MPIGARLRDARRGYNVDTTIFLVLSVPFMFYRWYAYIAIPLHKPCEPDVREAQDVHVRRYIPWERTAPQTRRVVILSTAYP